MLGPFLADFVVMVRARVENCVTTISIRRFFCRPASVVLLASGFLSANPIALICSGGVPPLIKAFRALSALAHERALLLGKVFLSSLLIT